MLSIRGTPARLAAAINAVTSARLVDMICRAPSPAFLNSLVADDHVRLARFDMQDRG
jgi:hypothetical protein